MAKNEFKMFAVNEDANVLSQEEYEALEALGAGFQSGIARSEQLNKVWRQASIMSAALADFIATQSGNDVIDDGDLVKIRASLLKALLAYSTNQLDSRYLNIVRNLSDLKDVPAARKSLGLKGAALLDVGATSGTVAAGNDSRIVNAVPNTRKINGHELSSDANVTAQDIFNGQAVGIGNAINLNTFTTAGLYYQTANAQAQTGKNYPETVAGSLEVYKHAGITQIYRVYNSSRAYIRTLYSGTWSAWSMQYDAANKPTAMDVSAIPLAGSTGVTGIVRSSAEMQSTSANSFRIAYGGYGVYWRNDGNRLYLMLTNKDDIYGGYNSLRPFYVDIATGNVALQHNVSVGGPLSCNSTITPGNYSNFDARYYTKGQTDAAYMAKTGAYTKGESDTRYQLKNTASLGDNGWHRDASTGLITQWMRVNRVGQYLTSFNFPMAFPSKCLAITFGEINTDNRSSQVNIWVYQYSRTGATIRMEEGERATFIIAKGY